MLCRYQGHFIDSDPSALISPGPPGLNTTVLSGHRIVNNVFSGLLKSKSLIASSDDIGPVGFETGQSAAVCDEKGIGEENGVRVNEASKAAVATAPEDDGGIPNNIMALQAVVTPNSTTKVQ